jgi:hypothetical protein
VLYNDHASLCKPAVREADVSPDGLNAACIGKAVEMTAKGNLCLKSRGWRSNQTAAQRYAEKGLG